MGVSQTYGKVAIPTVGENEPVFILRAQDKLAESAIEMYRLLAEAHGCQVDEALSKEISCFRQWSGEKKLPCEYARSITVPGGVVVGRDTGRHRGFKVRK